MTEENWITVAEAARFLGVTRQRIHQRIKRGQVRAKADLSPTAYGGRGFYWRIDMASLMQYKGAYAGKPAYNVTDDKIEKKIKDAS
jgi:hypothetical protein